MIGKVFTKANIYQFQDILQRIALRLILLDVWGGSYAK